MIWFYDFLCVFDSGSDGLNSEHHHLLSNPAIEQVWRTLPSISSGHLNRDDMALQNEQHHFHSQHQYAIGSSNNTSNAWPPSASSTVAIESPDGAHHWGSATANNNSNVTAGNSLWPQDQHQSNGNVSAMVAMAAAAPLGSSPASTGKLRLYAGSVMAFMVTF